MASLFQFDLVSPERSLISVEATDVNIPGSEGDFSSMIEHAPIITTLRPGFIKVCSPKGDLTYFVTGGFAEVSAAATSVLAEKAYLESDLTKEIASELINDANLKHEKSASDITAKYCSDLETALSKI
jgi:F-type H+-transporting ATPase subunit epsilon